MPSERPQSEVRLPLPIVPLKTAVRRVSGFLQQLPQARSVVLVPGLFGQVQLVHIEQAARFGFTGFCPQPLLFLGSMGALGFLLRRLGGESLLLPAFPGSAALSRLPGANSASDNKSPRHPRRRR